LFSAYLAEAEALAEAAGETRPAAQGSADGQFGDLQFFST
jgi:hypothetical protein